MSRKFVNVPPILRGMEDDDAPRRQATRMRTGAGRTVLAPSELATKFTRGSRQELKGRLC
jgi:hypothetical protein